LGIVRKLANRIYVMHEGKFVEEGETAAIFQNPSHEYTRLLISSEPQPRQSQAAVDAPMVLETSGLKVWFPIKAGLLRKTIDHVHAVDGVDLQVRQGHTIGVVGESGSGKTTLGMAVLRLNQSKGSIKFEGEELQGKNFDAMRPFRKEMQVVFQDPFGSLSPRFSIGQIVEEGLSVHHKSLPESERRDMAAQALQEVGLDPANMNRYPHEFSGGQRQRVSIARAIVLKPKLIVLDEPTSALDRTVQVQILELLTELQQRHNLTYMFISHDLKVVRAIADDVIVMRDGKIVERGACQQVLEEPETDYARALVRAAFDLAADTTGTVSQ
jgi:microcin C transport system ATP-binding protein